MFALAEYTEEYNTALSGGLAIDAGQRIVLPCEPFVRTSIRKTAYSTVIATLTGTLRSAQQQPVFLTFRIVHHDGAADNVALAFLPHIFPDENFRLPVTAQWFVREGGVVRFECISSQPCILEDASVSVLCMDVPTAFPAAETQSRTARKHHAHAANAALLHTNEDVPQARSGTAGAPTTIVCAPVIVFEGSEYISLEPGSQPGWVKIRLVNGE